MSKKMLIGCILLGFFAGYLCSIVTQVLPVKNELTIILHEQLRAQQEQVQVYGKFINSFDDGFIDIINDLENGGPELQNFVLILKIAILETSTRGEFGYTMSPEGEKYWKDIVATLIKRDGLPVEISHFLNRDYSSFSSGEQVLQVLDRIKKAL